MELLLQQERRTKLKYKLRIRKGKRRQIDKLKRRNLKYPRFIKK